MHAFTIALSLLLGSAFTSASDAAVKPTQTIPASCTTTSRHALVTHSCYTATAYTTRSTFLLFSLSNTFGHFTHILTLRSHSRRLRAPRVPPRTRPVMCPLFEIESIVTVPCKTDCCPTTPTTTVTTPCPSPCPECPHTVLTKTTTTGCPVSA
ncbi:hypothetical protein PG984_011472 [Apiospora sp. TS-2023a]